MSEKQDIFISNIANTKKTLMLSSTADGLKHAADYFDAKAADPTDADDPKWSKRIATNMRKKAAKKAKNLKHRIRDQMKDHIKYLEEQQALHDIDNTAKIARAKQQLAERSWEDK